MKNILTLTTDGNKSGSPKLYPHLEIMIPDSGVSQCIDFGSGVKSIRVGSTNCFVTCKTHVSLYLIVKLTIFLSLIFPSTTHIIINDGLKWAQKRGDPIFYQKKKKTKGEEEKVASTVTN